MDTRKPQPLRRQAASLALVALLLAACTRTIYVPQVSTEYVDRVTHDTTIVEHTEYVKEKGDTIYKEVTRYTYIVRERHDTLLRCDTIAVPYEVEKVVEVERKATAWERAKMKAGVCFFSLLGVGVIYAIYRLRKRLFHI